MLHIVVIITDVIGISSRDLFYIGLFMLVMLEIKEVNRSVEMNKTLKSSEFLKKCWLADKDIVKLNFLKMPRDT